MTSLLHTTPSPCVITVPTMPCFVATRRLGILHLLHDRQGRNSHLFDKWQKWNLEKMGHLCKDRQQTGIYCCGYFHSFVPALFIGKEWVMGGGYWSRLMACSCHWAGMGDGHVWCYLAGGMRAAAAAWGIKVKSIDPPWVAELCCSDAEHRLGNQAGSGQILVPLPLALHSQESAPLLWASFPWSI